MIYEHSTFTPKEKLGIYQTLDDIEHPIKWMFRDDNGSVKFVSYTKWLDDLDTELNKFIAEIFKRFCINNDVNIDSVYMSRLTMLVQNNDSVVCNPEQAYPNPEKRFLYFVTGSDRPMYVNDVPYMPIMGGGMLLDGNDRYYFLPPHKENFFTIVEIEFK